MDREELKAIVENVLLASDHPVTPGDLEKTLLNGIDKADLRSILRDLQDEYGSRNLQIIQVAEGYQLCTRHEYSEWIRKYLKLDKTTKLSQPSLDTLSIIAYKQPITRQEVEDIRGVDSSGVIKTLLEKKIIGPAGRKKVPGRPIMYRTTRKFLEYFGLKDLSDLPTLEDFQEELLGESDPTPQAEFSFGPGEGAGTADPEAPGEPGPAAEEAPGNGTGESNGDEPETEPRASLKEDEADAPGRR